MVRCDRCADPIKLTFRQYIRAGCADQCVLHRDDTQSGQHTRAHDESTGAVS